MNEVDAAFDAASATLWLGNGGSTSGSYAGLRFTNVSIPQGASITSAHLEVYSSQAQWIPINLQLAAEASDSSAAFSDASPPSQRMLTTMKVTYNTNVQWNADTWYALSEMRDVIQEVVDRPGWQSGNSLSLIVRGMSTGFWWRKFTLSYDGNPLFAPRLVVTYIVDTVPTPIPSATPTPTPINSPPSGDIVLTNLTHASRTTTYYAGDTFAYSVANASDDQPLPTDAFTWEIVFHHQQHTHPFLPSLPGISGQFTIPNTGETDPVVWYRVYLRIRDAGGLVTTVYRDLFPVTTAITLTTNLSGGQVGLDGATYPAPYTVARVVGMSVGIDVLSPQLIGGSYYTFHSWAHGGGKSHTITVPAAPTTYTAYLVAGMPTNSPTPLTATPAATQTLPALPPVFVNQATETSYPAQTLTPTASATVTETPTATDTPFLAPTATATSTSPPSPPPFVPPP